MLVITSIMNRAMSELGQRAIPFLRLRTKSERERERDRDREGGRSTYNQIKPKTIMLILTFPQNRSPIVT
jgi:hypothetical protein